MHLRWVVGLVAALAVAGCADSIKLTGSTGDGETFSGVAVAGGGFDQSGTLQLVSNRGMTCVGTYAFEGLSGPKGRADLSCSDGSTTVAALDMPSRTGVGALGTRQLHFRW